MGYIHKIMKALIQKAKASLLSVKRHGCYTSYSLLSKSGKTFVVEKTTKKNESYLSLSSEEKAICPSGVIHYPDCRGFFSVDGKSISLSEELIINIIQSN